MEVAWGMKGKAVRGFFITLFILERGNGYAVIRKTHKLRKPPGSVRRAEVWRGAP